MDISLIKAELKDAALLHDMQVRSFQALLEKYQDFNTNPANEPLEKTIDRIKQPVTDFYIIKNNQTTVGGIRIVKMGNRHYRVSPVFVLPDYQGKGIAQIVFSIIEKIYSDAEIWMLNTIMQERGNCYLYEKLGYRQTGKTHFVNDRMTLVDYEKVVPIEKKSS